MVEATDDVQMDPQALDRVRQLFQGQIEQGIHPGAALAVYRHGKLVLDLQGGLADTESGQPVDRDTMFVLFSSTKPLSAACLYLLWQRESLDWDDPLVKYWPGFGQNGKESVTIRHLLTHQGGFPQTPWHMTRDKWQDWGMVVEAMEGLKLSFEPGEAIAYHPRNFGWVIGELVRRIDGRTFDRFIREELALPLGMEDTYVGLPADLEERVSRIHPMPDALRTRMVDDYNQPEVHQAVLPAGGGIATARDLARFYALMAGGGTLDGVQLFQPQTVDEVTRPEVEGEDQTLERYVRRSLGMVLGDDRMGTRDVRTFGHGGAGTSVGWADQRTGLAFAYITNGFRGDHTNTARLGALSQAAREACG